MLNRLKRLLNIGDTSRDSLLNDLIGGVSQSLINRYLGDGPVPTALEHIVVDITAARFNRIGSEGMASQSEEGESLSFVDDDFASYDGEIRAYLDSQDEIGNRRKVRFL